MWKIVLPTLMCVAIILWFVVFTFPDDNLHIIACDVGQGDAFLIMQRTTQVLIDAGSGNKIIGCLGKYMPFWDRTLELAINTHPQLDHYEGFIEVFRRYNVKVFSANSLNSDAYEYTVLKTEVGSEGSQVIFPERGIVFLAERFDLTILHPSGEFVDMNTQLRETNTEDLGSRQTNLDPNEFSIITQLTFGDFDALFTGDAGGLWGSLIEMDLLSDIEYLKVPHHGSKNGITQDAVEVLQPEIAVISAGKNNSYGHPHKEILDLFNMNNIEIHQTNLTNSVEVVSNGVEWWVNDP